MDPYDYLDSDYEEFLRKEDKKMDSQKFILMHTKNGKTRQLKSSES
ncbi:MULTISPECIES: hypothetical protein [Enterococcus]|nr:hypothetical protein [Enterococcus faecalis]OTP17058.1 hypothetical protein A5830_000826 [Enterococcus faecalis]